MPSPDYETIMDALGARISSVLPALRVLHEPETFGGLEDGPAVGLYIVERQAPAERQRLEAGRSLHLDVKFSLMCAVFSLESIKRAKLDALNTASDVEQALMGDLTLGGAVRSMFVGGGMVDGGRGSGSFVGFAEVSVVCWVVSRL